MLKKIIFLTLSLSISMALSNDDNNNLNDLLDSALCDFENLESKDPQSRYHTIPKKTTASPKTIVFPKNNL